MPEDGQFGRNQAYYSLLGLSFEGHHSELEQNLEIFEYSFREYLTKCARISFPDRGEDFQEELIQQTWIKVWLKASQCMGCSRSSILSWFKEIVHRTGLSMLRDSQKLESFIDLEKNDSDDIEDISENDLVDLKVDWRNDPSNNPLTFENKVMLEDDIDNCMKRLTLNERKVFLLSLYGFSKTEIADNMMISRPRVTQYVAQIANKY